MTKSRTMQTLSDLVYLPKFDSGVFALWRRNFLYFKYTLTTTMAWIFVEPLLFLFALGYGLGRFVTNIDGLSYAEFIAPSMMATSGMFVAFFEGTYSTYTKMNRQKTYQTVLLTPLSTDEIVLGEIVWITSKAFLSVITVSIVLTALKLIDWHNLGYIYCILLLMCWGVAAMGVTLATLAKSYEWFSYFQSGIVTPMSLFCGTYFPLSQLPDGVRYLAHIFPLTHGMQSVRIIISQEFHSSLILHITYLFIFAVLMTNLACARMKRQLLN